MAKLQRLSESDLSLFPTCTYDLETTGLAADFGYILCAGIKPYGRPATVLRIDDFPLYQKDPSNDKALVAAFVKEITKYSIAISWNGVRFDMPFLVSRMIAHNMDVRCLTTIKQLDLIYAARYRMRLRGNSLAIVREHLQTSDTKTPLTGRIWAQAAAGNKKALDFIVKHNLQDLKVLEQVAKRLSNLIDVRFTLIR